MTGRNHAQARADNFVFSPVRGRNRAKSFELVPTAASCTSMGMQIPSFIFTEDEFRNWAARAAPGNGIVYHRGHLGSDRVQPFRAELRRVADLAGMLAERGQVLLVQKRIGPESCAYIAIKAAKPRPLGTFR
jgi:hypothetical protein